MTNTHQRLEKVISPYVASDSSMRRCAEAVLAAGWRPPVREIKTDVELDALPVGTIIADFHDYIAERCEFAWFTPGEDGQYHPLLPATIIHEADAA